MNKLIALVAVLLGFGTAQAQYFSSTAGQKFVYRESNTEQKIEQNYTAEVTEVTTDENGVVSAVYLERHPVPGNALSEIVNREKYTFNPADTTTTDVMMDKEIFVGLMKPTIKAQVEQMGQSITDEQLDEIFGSMKVSGQVELVLPGNPVAGTALKNSRMVAYLGPSKMTFALSKAVISALETVETPAGKFDCVKVEYQVKMTQPTGMETSFDTHWYAKGIGAVKTEGKDKKGNVTQSTELIEIK